MIKLNTSIFFYKVMYKELKEPCKSAIHNGLCLGCNLLELEDFESNPECEYFKKPTLKDSIEKINKILGIQLKIGDVKDDN